MSHNLKTFHGVIYVAKIFPRHITGKPSILTIPFSRQSCCLVWPVHAFPVAVVQTLAHNSTATLSVIKDYLINKLQRESQQIEDDERKISQYREETAHLRSEIQELRSRLVVCIQSFFYFVPSYALG